MVSENSSQKVWKWKWHFPLEDSEFIFPNFPIVNWHLFWLLKVDNLVLGPNYPSTPICSRADVREYESVCYQPTNWLTGASARNTIASKTNICYIDPSCKDICCINPSCKDVCCINPSWKDIPPRQPISKMSPWLEGEELPERRRMNHIYRKLFFEIYICGNWDLIFFLFIFVIFVILWFCDLWLHLSVNLELGLGLCCGLLKGL